MLKGELNSDMSEIVLSFNSVWYGRNSVQEAVMFEVVLITVDINTVFLADCRAAGVSFEGFQIYSYFEWH